jgi:AraC family transcriptional regulator
VRSKRLVGQRFCEARAWPGVRSEWTWLPPDAGVTVTKPLQIGVSFSEHPRTVLESAGGHTEIDVPAGAVFVTGREPLTWARVQGHTDALEMYLDLALLTELAAQSRGDSVEPVVQPALAIRDAVVLAIAAVFKRAHAGGLPLDDVAAGTLAHRLAWHMLTAYCGLRGPQWLRRPGSLSPRAVQRVADLIEAEPSEPLTLGRLADEVSLSPYHFARSFKAATGLAPHQFVTMRRIERAKTLLTTTRASVEHVAHSVGFSNVSHFRRVFRQHTGWLPGDLRGRGGQAPR